MKHDKDVAWLKALLIVRAPVLFVSGLILIGLVSRDTHALVFVSMGLLTFYIIWSTLAYQAIIWRLRK